jgi:hypothetical protein
MTVRIALAALFVVGLMAGAAPQASADYYLSRYEYGDSHCGSPTDPMNWRMYYGPAYTGSDLEDSQWIANYVDWRSFYINTGLGSTGYAYNHGAGRGGCIAQQSYYNKLGSAHGHHTRLFSNNGPDAAGRSDSGGDAHRETFQPGCLKDAVDKYVREGGAMLSGFDAGVHELRFGIR